MSRSLEEALGAAGFSTAPDLGDVDGDDGFADHLVESIFGNETGHIKNPAAQWTARNPSTGALGRYQILPSNVPGWTKKHLGRAYSPEEFIRDPQAQTAVAKAELMDAYREGLKHTGDQRTAVRWAASRWFSGHGKNFDRTDINDGHWNVQTYTTQALRNFENYRGVAPQVEPVAQHGDSLEQALRRAGFQDGPQERLPNPMADLQAIADGRPLPSGQPQPGAPRLPRGVEGPTRNQRRKARQRATRRGGFNLGDLVPDSLKAGLHMLGWADQPKPKPTKRPKGAPEVIEGQDYYAAANGSTPELWDRADTLRALDAELDKARAAHNQASIDAIYAMRKQAMGEYNAALSRQQLARADLMATGQAFNQVNVDLVASRIAEKQRQGLDVGYQARRLAGVLSSVFQGTPVIPEAGAIHMTEALGATGSLNRALLKSYQENFGYKPGNDGADSVWTRLYQGLLSSGASEVLRLSEAASRAIGNEGLADAASNTRELFTANPIEAGSAFISGLTGIQNSDLGADPEFLSLNPQQQQAYLDRLWYRQLVPSLLGGTAPYYLTGLMGPLSPLGAAGIGALRAAAGFFDNPQGLDPDTGLPAGLNLAATPDQNANNFVGAVAYGIWDSALQDGLGRLTQAVGGRALQGVHVGPVKLPALPPPAMPLAERLLGGLGEASQQYASDVFSNWTLGRQGLDLLRPKAGVGEYLSNFIAGAGLEGSWEGGPIYVGAPDGRIASIDLLGEVRLVDASQVPRGEPIVDFQATAPRGMSFDALFGKQADARQSVYRAIYKNHALPFDPVTLPDMERVTSEPEVYKQELLDTSQAADVIAAGRERAEAAGGIENLDPLIRGDYQEQLDKHPELDDLSTDDLKALALQSRATALNVDAALSAPDVAKRFTDVQTRRASDLVTAAQAQLQEAQGRLPEITQAKQEADKHAQAAEQAAFQVQQAQAALDAAHAEAMERLEAANQLDGQLQSPRLAPSLRAYIEQQIPRLAPYTRKQLADAQAQFQEAQQQLAQSQAALREAQAEAHRVETEVGTVVNDATDGLKKAQEEATAIQQRVQKVTEMAQARAEARRKVNEALFKVPEKTRLALRQALEARLNGLGIDAFQAEGGSQFHTLDDYATALTSMAMQLKPIMDAINPDAPAERFLASILDGTVGSNEVNDLFRAYTAVEQAGEAQPGGDGGQGKGFYDPSSKALLLTKKTNLTTLFHEFFHALEQNNLFAPEDQAALDAWARRYLGTNRNRLLRRNPNVAAMAILATPRHYIEFKAGLSVEDQAGLSAAMDEGGEEGALNYLLGTQGMRDTVRDFVNQLDALPKHVEDMAMAEAKVDAFEGFLRQGKPPEGASAKVQALFQKLGQLFTGQYQSLFASHLVDPEYLTPEVRDFFERLLGTEAVATAQRQVVVDEQARPTLVTGAGASAVQHPAEFGAADDADLWRIGEGISQQRGKEIQADLEALASRLGISVPEARSYAKNAYADMLRQSKRAGLTGEPVTLRSRIQAPEAGDSPAQRALRRVSNQLLAAVDTGRFGVVPQMRADLMTTLARVYDRPVASSEVDEYLGDHMPQSFWDRMAEHDPDEAPVYAQRKLAAQAKGLLAQPDEDEQVQVVNGKPAVPIQGLRNADPRQMVIPELADLAKRHLLAVHTVSPEKLGALLEMGGQIMPSIGVIRPEKRPLTRFGPVTLVYDKSTIDPRNPANHVYTSDIFSPRQPETRRTLNLDAIHDLREVAPALEEALADINPRLRRQVLNLVSDPLGTVGDILGDSESMPTGEMGDFARGALSDSHLLKLYYLATQTDWKGEGLEDAVAPPRLWGRLRPGVTAEAVQDFLHKHGYPSLDDFKEALERGEGGEDYNALLDAFDVHPPYVLPVDPASSSHYGASMQLDQLKSYLRVLEEGGELDRYKLGDALEDTGKLGPDYEAWAGNWVDQLASGEPVFQGIASGQMRPYTVENALDEMLLPGMRLTEWRSRPMEYATDSQTSSALAARRLRSIDEIRAREGQLTDQGTLTEMDADRRDAEQELADLSGISKEGLHALFGQYFRGRRRGVGALRATAKRLGDEGLFRQIDRIPADFFEQAHEFAHTYLQDQPVPYFEAKPRRFVPLEEVRAALVPRTLAEAKPELVETLKERGIPVHLHEEEAQGEAQRDLVPHLLFQPGEELENMAALYESDPGALRRVFEGDINQRLHDQRVSRRTAENLRAAVNGLLGKDRRLLEATLRGEDVPLTKVQRTVLLRAGILADDSRSPVEGRFKIGRSTGRVQGTLELAAIHKLENDPQVADWQPIRQGSIEIPYGPEGALKYRPDDFIVHYKGAERPTLVEVKSNQGHDPDMAARYAGPLQKITSGRGATGEYQAHNMARYDAAKAWAAENGYDFEVWTEESLGEHAAEVRQLTADNPSEFQIGKAKITLSRAQNLDGRLAKSAARAPEAERVNAKLREAQPGLRLAQPGPEVDAVRGIYEQDGAEGFIAHANQVIDGLTIADAQKTVLRSAAKNLAGKDRATLEAALNGKATPGIPAAQHRVLRQLGVTAAEDRAGQRVPSWSRQFAQPMADDVPDRVIAAATNPDEGGISIRPDGAQPTTGYMASIPGYEDVLGPASSPDIQDAIRAYAARPDVAKLLAEHPNYHLGAWTAPDGNLVMDVSERVTDGQEARRLGRERGQYGIFDLSKQEGDGGFIPTADDDADVQRLRAPQGVAEARANAEGYARERGLPQERLGYRAVDTDTQRHIADLYEAARHNPDDPEVQRTYQALKDETAQQFRYLQDKGVKFEAWRGQDEQPYRDSKEMMADVAKGHLYFFTGGDMPANHPLAADAGITVPGSDGTSVPLTYNDVFRAVHDYFGHAVEGYQFGLRGEYNATRAHSRLYSPEALDALLTETLGQNPWVNLGAHLRTGPEGAIPGKGEAGYVPPTERPFAEQKATILPGVRDTWSGRLAQPNYEGDVLDLYHLSRVPGLQELDPTFLGTGTKSQETRRGIPPLKRTFYYLGGTEPERIVRAGAKTAYQTRLDTAHFPIYDLGTDPAGIVKQWRDAGSPDGSEGLLQRIYDADYAGYTNSAYQSMSNVVAVFKPLQVTEVPLEKAQFTVTDGQLAADGRPVGRIGPTGQLIAQPGDDFTDYHKVVVVDQEGAKGSSEKLLRVARHLNRLSQEQAPVLQPVTPGASPTAKALYHTEAVARAAHNGVREVVDFVKTFGADRPSLRDVVKGSFDWYQASITDTQRSLAGADPVFSGLAVDEHGKPVNHRESRLFRFLVGAFSPGADPDANLRQAADAYADFRRLRDSLKQRGVNKALLPLVDVSKTVQDKQSDDVYMGGSYSRAGFNNIIKLNRLATEKSGGDVHRAVDWLLSAHPVDEVAEVYHYTSEGDSGLHPADFRGELDENGEYRYDDEIVHDGKALGAYAFGPKVGAFIANLNGFKGELTPDLWWSRTWNRWQGTLLYPKRGEDAKAPDTWTGVSGVPRNNVERHAMRDGARQIARDLTARTDPKSPEYDAEFAKALGLDGKHVFGVSEIQSMLWYMEQQYYAAQGHPLAKSRSYDQEASRLADIWTTYDANRRQTRQAVLQTWLAGDLGAVEAEIPQTNGVVRRRALELQAQLLRLNQSPVEKLTDDLAAIFHPQGAGVLAQPSAEEPSVSDRLWDRLQRGGAVTDEDVVRLLGEKPEYLNDVTRYLIQQRDKIRNGKLTTRDVAKAYLLALSSINATEQVADQIAEGIQKGGLDPELHPLAALARFGIPAEDFLSQKPQAQQSMFGDARETKMRPEDFFAKFLFTDAGQRMLDALERGDTVDIEAALQVRGLYGGAQTTIGNAAKPVTTKAGSRYSLQNLQELTDALNAAGKQGPEAVEALLPDIRGIGADKTGFLMQLLGFGHATTVDAVEKNYWLAGVAAERDASAELRPLIQYAKGGMNADDAARLRAWIEDRFARLTAQPEIRKQLTDADLDPGVFNTIMHHWLWDRAKGTETHHRGFYKAMLMAQPSGEASEVAARNVKAESLAQRFATGVTTLVRAGMLTNPNTHVVNNLSNLAHLLILEAGDVPAAALDAFSSVFDGQRTKTYSPYGSLRALGYVFKKGESPESFHKGGIQLALERYREAKQGEGVQQGTEENAPRMSDGLILRIAKGYSGRIYGLLSAQDALAYTYHLHKNLYDLALAEAKTSGGGRREALSILESPDDAMIDQAEAAALSATFQNSTLPHQVVESVKRSLGSAPHIGPALRFAVDSVIPFSKTPSSIVVKGLDLLGGHYIRAVGNAVDLASLIRRGALEEDMSLLPEYRAMKRQLVENTGRGLVGTAMLIGAILGLHDKLQPLIRETEKDKALASLRAGTGYTGGRLIVGGYTYDISKAGPLSTVLFAGAAVGQALRRGEGFSGAMQAALEQAGDAFLQHPLIEGTKEAFNGVFGEDYDRRRFAAGQVSRYVPATAIVSAIARQADPHEREAKTIPDMLKTSIPGLRDRLPVKEDPLTGEPMQRRSVSPFAPFSPQRYTGGVDPAAKLAAALLLQPPQEGEPRKGESPDAYQARLRRKRQLWRQYMAEEAGRVGDLDPREISEERRKQLREEVTDRIDKRVNAVLNKEFPQARQTRRGY